MTTEIRVPTLGESVTEATVAQWFKAEGEFVNADEPLCELETDKVTLEVPAPPRASGPRSLPGPMALSKSMGSPAQTTEAPARARPSPPRPTKTPNPNRPRLPVVRKSLPTRPMRLRFSAWQLKKAWTPMRLTAPALAAG